MPTITVEGVGAFDVEPGKKLVLAIEDSGVDILHRCGGQAKCTTCRVEVLEGDAPPMEAAERDRLATEPNLPPNTRLSCQIRVTGDLSVRVLNRSSTTGKEPGPRPAD
ncbi:2Fe-2S iron-sulfur cluster-binding protein [Tautonia sociabilis]|uniref:(2Fe-2S)-binding protein n=1 Tax=Tautonia sociabilis TaxID=2080755 RepID=A0A432MP24_9BACT|nr:2Fe-2S iron-sulfur cluster-binding protein [Tautonia sociabilis]RUL89009.1 (2Fe-2S)-binding protein [Tautonia sociabilis]